jgi:hypothetical protein
VTLPLSSSRRLIGQISFFVHTSHISLAVLVLSGDRDSFVSAAHEQCQWANAHANRNNEPTVTLSSPPSIQNDYLLLEVPKNIEQTTYTVNGSDDGSNAILERVAHLRSARLTEEVYRRVLNRETEREEPGGESRRTRAKSS